MENDIVTRLRGTVYAYSLRGILREAADEIERLRGNGCARDQRTTQFCAEALRLQRERDDARREVCRFLARESKRDPQYWIDIAANESPTAADVAKSRGWDLYERTATNGD
jgi:hypothetical protein